MERLPMRARLDTPLTLTREIVTGRVRGIAQVETQTLTIWGRQLFLNVGQQISQDGPQLRSIRRCRWHVRRPVGPDAVQFAAGDVLTDPDGQQWHVTGVTNIRRQRMVELFCTVDEAGQGSRV